MAKGIEGKRVAILATDGFEQSELFEPKRRLEEAGAVTTVVSLKGGEIKGWNEQNWGESVKVDKTVGEVSAQDFDALLLPGGVMNPDKLRADAGAVEFAKGFVTSGKPIGAICHGPWLLIEAGGISNRRVTSWPSLKTDLENAGGSWSDEAVVTDKGMVTSRKPADIPMFSDKLIEEIGEGVHADRKATLI